MQKHPGECRTTIPPIRLSDIGLRKKGTTLSESKKMSVVQLTAITAINMMGSGIILLPSKLAEIGTVSIFAWIFASLGATILAYAFARCGMYTKKAGGMGGFAEYRFGKLGNFLANFTYTISLIIANVAIATSVVSYGSYIFGFELTPAVVCAATIGTLCVGSAISLIGPKRFGSFGTLGMIFICLPVIGLLLFGWKDFSLATYEAAWNPNDLPFYASMRDSIAIILWGFLGLETACANSNTVKNPEKNVPIAVLCGTLISGICYTISTAIIGGIIPHTTLATSNAPFGLAYAAILGDKAGYAVSCMLVFSCFVSLMTWQFTVSEVAREASHIGLFPSFLQKVNQYHAPYKALITLVGIQSILTLLTISPTLLDQFAILINLAVMINLVPYLLSMIAVPDLQKAEFIPASQAKWTNYAAMIGSIYSVYAVYGCGWSVILQGVGVMILGIIIYTARNIGIRANNLETYPPYHFKK